MFKNFIFDLDGTLLDTIEGIRLAINQALRECGFEHQFDRDGTVYLIGDGADVLVRRALKEHYSEENFARLKARYMPLYKAYQETGTFEFPNVAKTLQILKKSGKSLFVASNKPDLLAGRIISKFFGNDLFSKVSGHREEDPVKPNPITVSRIEDEFGILKEETLYVGDSHVDIETARNAGIRCCLLTWGYDHYTPELLARADYVLPSIDGLLNL